MRRRSFLALPALFASSARAQDADDPVIRALQLYHPVAATRAEASAFFVRRGGKDAIPVLVMALRYVPEAHIGAALAKLSGETKLGLSWFDWMIYVQNHPEAGVMPGFDIVFADIHARIDPNFLLFIRQGVRHDIRLEEIVWGGVVKDGIPALTNPKLIAARDAPYLGDEEFVFGVAINGDIRAYPLRFMDWHEMFNDVIGGVPLSLAYCTLCGSGILFETKVDGRERPFVFGSSGFLYRSNKLMYDTETNSLWNQFTGRPVVGQLTGSGIELRTRPVVITTWGDWRRRHPETRVLALETGHRRDYRPGAAYGSYFASQDLMFPAVVDQRPAKQKDMVFALRSSGAEKAWPLSAFKGGAVINDSAGALDLVLIGDQATRSVRAFRREGLTFSKGRTATDVQADGALWQVTEDALIGPNGRQLTRLPGHIAFWFAWSGYFGDQGVLARP